VETKEAVTEIRARIFQIRGLNGSSHSYIIKGDYMNVMIDSGSAGSQRHRWKTSIALWPTRKSCLTSEMERGRKSFTRKLRTIDGPRRKKSNAAATRA
jgi:hypothetical protein